MRKGIDSHLGGEDLCLSQFGYTYVARQVGFADAPKHPQIGFEQGEQAFCPVLMHVTARIFLLRMVDKVVHIALETLEGPIFPPQRMDVGVTLIDVEEVVGLREHRHG